MSLIVVSDASPIRALHHLGLLPLCRELYGIVVVPEAVQRELRQATTTCPALEVTDYAWFEIRSFRADAQDLRERLVEISGE